MTDEFLAPTAPSLDEEDSDSFSTSPHLNNFITGRSSSPLRSPRNHSPINIDMLMQDKRCVMRITRSLTRILKKKGEDEYVTAIDLWIENIEHEKRLTEAELAAGSNEMIAEVSREQKIQKCAMRLMIQHMQDFRSNFIQNFILIWRKKTKNTDINTMVAMRMRMTMKKWFSSCEAAGLKFLLQRWQQTMQEEMENEVIYLQQQQMKKHSDREHACMMMLQQASSHMYGQNRMRAKGLIGSLRFHVRDLKTSIRKLDRIRLRFHSRQLFDTFTAFRQEWRACIRYEIAEAAWIKRELELKERFRFKASRSEDRLAGESDLDCSVVAMKKEIWRLKQQVEVLSQWENLAKQLQKERKYEVGEKGKVDTFPWRTAKHFSPPVARAHR